MEENQIQTEIQSESLEPEKSDNSEVKETDSIPETVPAEEIKNEGQSEENKDPSEQLILGKFKSVEDLTKAYEELQKYQGSCSDELGQLRKVVSTVNGLNSLVSMMGDKFSRCFSYLSEVKPKYNTPEYFQNPSFNAIFDAAFNVLGENLDTDKFINLLDGYVTSRMEAAEKKKAASNETQKILDSMGYSKNPKTSFTPPKKRLDEMTPKEVDEMLDRLI